MAEDLADRLKLRGLDTSAVDRAGPGVRPVDLWDPPDCGEIDMRIDADGSWHYRGGPISRRSMVELFASILRRDANGRYYLVTPVEKHAITVADAPFIAAQMRVEGAGRGQRLIVTTNVGDEVAVGPGNALRFAADAAGTAGLRPYVLVRGRLEALFSRALAIDLADLIVEEAGSGAPRLGVWSAGAFFEVAPAAAGA